MLMLTNTPNGSTPAREYLRVSLDRSGRERSQTEQHDDNQRAADEHGIKLGKPYQDTGSASRYARKARDGYDQLVTDLEADQFGAEILMLWESSRGSRTVLEWVLLLDLLEKRNIRICVTTHGRLYDPANARDRRTLLEDAVDSEYESAKTSKRMLRARAAEAVQGLPHGRVPYGYRRRYEIVGTRKVLVAQEPEPDEAKVIKELFTRIIKGHSLRSIAIDFEQRGIRSRNGKVISSHQLGAMARRHAYAGLRYHEPGRTGGNTKLDPGKGTVVDGTWPSLITRETWYAVQRILTAPERRTFRPGRAVHLLSSIARCDVCSGPMSAHIKQGRSTNARYVCHSKGCVSVPYGELDDYAEAVILAYLADPRHVKALTKPDDTGAELQVVKDEIADLHGELDDLERGLKSGDISPWVATTTEQGIRERLADAEQRAAALATPSLLRGLITPGADVARRWKAAPVSTKREIARILLSPEIIGELRIVKAPQPRTRFPITERVTWRRA